MRIFDRFIAGEARELNQKTRAELPGLFVKLSAGITHYDLQGPQDGVPLILIHGFSVPYFIWDPTIKALASGGFRVVRYDLFGRGFSDRPKGPYDSRLFREQLNDLIEHLSITKGLNLCSLSMGGVIAADFAKHFPEKISRLSFIDPAGFDLNAAWLFRALKLPGVGEILLGILGRLGKKSILQSMVADFYQPNQASVDAFIALYKKQMHFQGFKRALLSSLRSGMLDENLALFRGLSHYDFPVQLIWGEEDQTVPYMHHLLFQSLLPRTEFHSIRDAGHIPHFEKPDEVNRQLIEFFEVKSL